MPTNLAIDDKLLAEALRIGGRRTKRDTVNEALAEYIQHRKQADIISLFGTVDIESASEAKAQRSRK